LLLHEVGEDAGVGGEAGEGEAEVLIDGDYLLLVRRELFGITLRVDSLVSLELLGLGEVVDRN
jgi:hypothetical protein